MTCSCGEKGPHIIARRRTMDGVEIEFWSDGGVTGRLGIYPKGLGPTRGSSGTHLRAPQLIMGDVCLYDWAEIGPLVKAARRALTQSSFPPEVYLRRVMAGEKFRVFGKVVKSV